jgi:hypothetical protein
MVMLKVYVKVDISFIFQDKGNANFYFKKVTLPLIASVFGKTLSKKN